MNLQYISDSNGKTTGVFIPIDEWNILKNKFKGIEDEEFNIPEWQTIEVRERKEKYKNKTDSAQSFDSAISDIDKEL